MTSTVFLIEEIRHFVDGENRRQDESSINIDHGVFSCLEEAEQAAAALNSNLYTIYEYGVVEADVRQCSLGLD